MVDRTNAENRRDMSDLGIHKIDREYKISDFSGIVAGKGIGKSPEDIIRMLERINKKSFLDKIKDVIKKYTTKIR